MERYRYVVNVDGAVYRDGEYLLVERAADEDHAAGALGFRGGKLEASPGSASVLEDTARREVFEEVGSTSAPSTTSRAPRSKPTADTGV